MWIAMQLAGPEGFQQWEPTALHPESCSLLAEELKRRLRRMGDSALEDLVHIFQDPPWQPPQTEPFRLLYILGSGRQLVCTYRIYEFEDQEETVIVPSAYLVEDDDPPIHAPRGTRSPTSLPDDD